MASADLFDDGEHGQKFDVDEYIERLAWRALGGGTRGDFNARILYDELSSHVEQLKVLDDKLEKKAQTLEKQLVKDAKSHADKLVKLQSQHQEAFSCFKELDEKINIVAGKVVVLGEQLEATNQPRAHCVEAVNLMEHFRNFQLQTAESAELFSDRHRLDEQADVIRKLRLIALELSDSKFHETKIQIKRKYDDIEKNLVERFREATENNQKDQMKQYADILSNFKGYQKCIDEFVDMSIKKIQPVKSGVFQHVIQHSMRIEQLSRDVFTHPEQVLQKFLQVVYDDKLRDYINEELQPLNVRAKYLSTMYDLKKKINEMNQELLRSLGKEVLNETILLKLDRGLFHEWINEYVDIECTAVQDNCHECLKNYYQKLGHDRPETTESNFQPFQKSYFSGFSSAEPTEILLSETVATEVLQASKQGLHRCDVLSFSNNKAENATKIFQVLLKNLGKDHILYALDVCIGSLPSGKDLEFPKVQPDLNFLSIIQEVNQCWHLAEKQFNDDLLPMITSTPSHAKCLDEKNRIKTEMENKCGEVIDRALSLSTGWIRQILKTKQRAADFSEKNAELSIGRGGSSMSSACREVSRSIQTSLDGFREMLDGDNLPIVLCELGTRFHKCIREHLMTFQSSIGMMGGLMLICDVNQYVEVSKKFDVVLVQQLFGVLHALCNLLIQQPEKIRQVCSSEELANLDREVLHSFVRLRADYRESNLEKFFS